MPRKGERVMTEDPDLFGIPDPPMPVHACAGPHCQVCHRLDRNRLAMPAPMAIVRTDDPVTSKKAARSVERESLLQALLSEFAREDLTFEEAAERAQIDPWQASKRVSDLANVGYVEPVITEEGPLTRKGRSGRQQRVLRITMLGSDALDAVTGGGRG